MTELRTVKFPNVPGFSLKLKTRKVCLADVNSVTCSDYHSLEEILQIASKVDRFELGGEFHPKNGFIVDPSVTYYDNVSDRPYTLLNKTAKTHIVWHSHPFLPGHSFPSVEDLDTARLFPALAHIILTQEGVYLVSALQPWVGISHVIKFYSYMQNNSSCSEWDLKTLNESFLSNRGFSREALQKYHLFVHLIPKDHLTRKNFQIMLRDAYTYKNAVLKDPDIERMLKQI